MPNVLPERLEAGTLAVPAIASLGAGIDYVRLRSIQEIAAYENKLLLELYDRLSEIRKVQLYCRSKEKEGTTLLFNVDGIDAEQVAMLLAKQHICVRSGLHCSPLAHQSLGTPGGAVRVSLSPFNKREDLDSLYYAIQEWL
jgi:selenocysteine lyase/cysteine desulfurase